jgi:hypothetical protein
LPARGEHVDVHPVGVGHDVEPAGAWGLTRGEDQGIRVARGVAQIIAMNVWSSVAATRRRLAVAASFEPHLTEIFRLASRGPDANGG